jgi:hypothetical protein
MEEIGSLKKASGRRFNISSLNTPLTSSLENLLKDG